MAHFAGHTLLVRVARRELAFIGSKCGHVTLHAAPVIRRVVDVAHALGDLLGVVALQGAVRS